MPAAMDKSSIEIFVVRIIHCSLLLNAERTKKGKEGAEAIKKGTS
jgi:hypothetical protein